MVKRIFWVVPALFCFLAVASPSWAVMDFAGITCDSESVLAGALCCVAGFCATWAIKLVIGIFKK